MKKYDSDHSGRLNFRDFKTCIVPISEEYASILLQRQPFFERRTLPLREYFQRDTRYAYASLMQKLLQTEQQCELIRQRLSR